MSTIKRFEDLNMWQKSKILCHNIYEIIHEEKFSKDYKLKEQINGSSGSIMDNIAEGFDRNSRLEFIYFLGIAKGSSGETKSQLYRALDRKYICQEKFDELYFLVDEISKMISAFISYLNKSTIKGTKFKDRSTN
jgi:four helix bundle protein